jgi:uncharacterized protein YyaL (SSP411 family)
VRLALILALAVACRGEARPQLRFSPRPNRAAEIHWRAWAPSVFADARATKKPILLSLSAIWCHWCHVLDETTLSDARVIARLNRDFIPVRVDADQHPDIERRYILGGWPTVAVLTADGEIVAGGTYVPPDDFVALLDGALADVRAGGATLEARLARYRHQLDPTAPGELDTAIIEGVVRALAGAHDPVNGGFGGAPKFPHGRAVVLLLEAGETDVARRALDAMLKLEDPVEGGFFRYATRADWTHPHYEKMLSGNAELLEAYARGFSTLHDARYRAAAQRTIAWVRRTLFDEKSGALWASQDADERYYAADARGRASLRAPYIDRTLLVDRAAQMIEALRVAGRALGDPSADALARRAADALLPLQDRDGLFRHAADARGQLADQARAALALLAFPDEKLRAAGKRALAAAQAKLAAPEGGYDDAEPTAEGLLHRRERPLVENALFARAQLAAGDRAAAEKTLRAFAGAYRFYGTEAAEYALAVSAWLSDR